MKKPFVYLCFNIVNSVNKLVGVVKIDATTFVVMLSLFFYVYLNLTLLHII